MHQLLNIMVEQFLELVASIFEAISERSWSLLKEFDYFTQRLTVFLRSWCELFSIL